MSKDKPLPWVHHTHFNCDRCLELCKHRTQPACLILCCEFWAKTTDVPDVLVTEAIILTGPRNETEDEHERALVSFIWRANWVWDATAAAGLKHHATRFSQPLSSRQFSTEKQGNIREYVIPGLCIGHALIVECSAVSRRKGEGSCSKKSMNDGSTCVLSRPCSQSLYIMNIV